MSFIISAPVPALQSFIVIPNPEFADTEGKPVSVNFKRTMNGVKRTFIKSNDRRILSWQFRLTRAKGVELQRFFTSYFRAKLQVEDHKGQLWQGYLTNDPFEFAAETRAGGWPGGEQVSIRVEFQGERVSAPDPTDCE